VKEYENPVSTKISNPTNFFAFTISEREEIEVKEFSSSVAINSLENGKQLLRQVVLNQGVQKLQLCCHCYAVR